MISSHSPGEPVSAPTLEAPKPAIGGLVLAGGRSSRFGREKAVAELNGEPLITWAWRVLQAGCSDVAVSARAGSAAEAFAGDHALPRLTDAQGDAEGPLAGVRAGLVWAVSQGFGWLATAPCDTPFLPTDFVARLYAAGQQSGAVAVTPQGIEPLCALWPVSTLGALGRPGEHPPVHGVLERIGAARVWFEDASAFVNLNTPEDHARVRRVPD